MKLRNIIAIGILVGVCSLAAGEARIWTDQEGRTATAEFVGLEGETLILKKGARTIRVPLANFSAEDQEYVHTQIEKAEAERERSEKERRETIQSLLGLIHNVAIKERRWENWKDYYTESVCGEEMLDFFENERSIVDVKDKGVFVSAKDAVRPADYAPTMTTFCPEDYDGIKPYGVYIHISPGGGCIPPDNGYQEIMKKYRLIYASPNGTSNDEADMRRLAITLDALAQLRKSYEVDENRIYVGGFSGGGAEATMAAFLYPEDFRAALNSGRGFSLTANYCLPFAVRKEIRSVQKYKQPYAFISGPNDIAYNFMPNTVDNFKEHRFVAHFFDIPGMGHETAPAEAFDEVMEWVEEENPRL